MEVFMRNLPSDLTNPGLRKSLEPCIKAIGAEDWSCQKQRKKRFGNVTFLRQSDGIKFLARYDRNSNPQARPFNILGSPVRCSKSTKEPDKFHLKSLQKAAEDRLEIDPYQKQVQDTTVSFNATSFSCGCYTYVDENLSYSPSLTWSMRDGLAKFAKSVLIVTYSDYTGPKRIEFPYRIIESIYISHDPPALTLTLWETPRFYAVSNSSSAQLATPDQDLAALIFSLNLEQGSNSPSKVRLSKLPHTQNHAEVMAQTAVYQIGVTPGDLNLSLSRLLQVDGLSTYQYNISPTPSSERRDMSRCMKSFSSKFREWSKALPFGVLYQIEALVRNGYLPPWTVENMVPSLIQTQRTAHATNLGYPISAAAIRKLMSQIPFPAVGVNASTFSTSEILEYLQKNEAELQNGYSGELLATRVRGNMTLVFKAKVTPTGMTLHGPEPEPRNRILRRFPDHSDYFIRVQFSEEDGTDLQFNSSVSNKAIFERFKKIFMEGIAIGGRLYKFLGFSHSSLRSHSAWFMATFTYERQLQTYFSVISHLGEFDDIRSPAKCAARIGQAFSETPFAVSLEENGIGHSKIADVSSLDGKRVFSDGVGVLSQEAIEAINAALPQRRKALLTCFQIRWGGAKGMLALDARLDGNVMKVRDSMVKFKSSDLGNLEICGMASKPSPMYLNRQMIKILEDMGIPNNWFITRQREAVHRLKLITANVANTIYFLRRHGIADGIGFPQLIRQLDDIGIDYKADRFLRSVVEAAVLRELRLLKYKARILIPQGVTLYGILDETGYLEEGQIYVTFDDTEFIDHTAEELHDTLMIITRSPALHPGDIQLARNIIPPDHSPLRRLRNCVVFSQKGARDLPSCLSGGDLDGDDYNVIWDDEAVRGCKRVFPPADYTRVTPVALARPVNTEDMTDFFVNFMDTDRLGLIAIRHMIFADQKDDGTLDPECIMLAEMHSTGVDYSKTGIPVDMEKFGKMKANRYRPDFLSPSPQTNVKDRTEISFEATVVPSQNDSEEDADDTRPRHEYYKSTKINGILYRAIKEKNIWYEDIRVSVPQRNDIFNTLLGHLYTEYRNKLGGEAIAEATIEEAWGIRHAYEDAIFDTTLDYSEHASKPITELEVFTGEIFNSSGIQSRRQRDKSVKLRDEFDRIARWAENMMRKRERNVATTENDEVRSEITTEADIEGLALSLACLRVGCLRDNEYAHASRGGGRAGSEMLSFKVVAACCCIRAIRTAVKLSEGGVSLFGF